MVDSLTMMDVLFILVGIRSSWISLCTFWQTRLKCTSHFRPLLSFPETGARLLLNKTSSARRSMITGALFRRATGERRHNLPAKQRDPGLRLKRAATGNGMLKQQGGEPLLRDGPQVFGKPWFWQRSSGAVDGSRGLACVLMEMRDEIKKLEAENRQLRADCCQLSSGDDPEEAEQQPEENPYLRRNASAPALKGQNQGRPRSLLQRASSF